MSQIDLVVSLIGTEFHHLSAENYIRVMDTPRVWGMPLGPAIMDQARTRQGQFERALQEVVQKAKYRCDLSSLNCPDPDWTRVIIGAMDTCLSTPMGRQQPTQFRFLFGQTPMVPVGEPANYTELKAAIIRLIRDRAPGWERLPSVYLGRFYRLEAGILSVVQAKVFGSSIIGSDDTKMTWNHSKIVAVDGVEALAGGHNLNMDLFRSYPPVHDVSVVMHGDGAYGAQQYLDQMWACGDDLVTKEMLTADGTGWTSVPGSTAVPDPLAPADVQASMVAAQNALLARHGSGTQPAAPPDPPASPPVSGIRDDDLQTLTMIDEPVFPERVRFTTYAGFDEYSAATRVLSLGKYWTGPNDTDFHGASELMKQELILGARTSIKMSQMDLVSAWKKNWTDHTVCQLVIRALLTNPALEVQIVVSPLDAGAGAEGDQYSFGSGAVRTYALLEYYMTHDVATDQPLPDSDGARQAALTRLHVAPFVYTDQVPADRAVEGDTYVWPQLTPTGYTATLKQPTLEERPPRQGIIGSAARAVLSASGYIDDRVPSAPGNHAKIMIVDDEAYVVGSDNLYPGYLSEFDYLIEGQQAVNRLLADYWTPLWAACSPHAVGASQAGGYTRSEPPVGGQATTSPTSHPPGGR